MAVKKSAKKAAKKSVKKAAKKAVKKPSAKTAKKPRQAAPVVRSAATKTSTPFFEKVIKKLGW